MNDSPINPQASRARLHNDYEDPHYHDEDSDIHLDDHPREGKLPIKRKPPRKLPPPSRRHYED
jgi:hypothetical protein